MADTTRDEHHWQPTPPVTRSQDDEVDEVMAALRHLYQRVTSPIIRECLEAAGADIAYLTSTTPRTTHLPASAEFYDDESDDLFGTNGNADAAA